EGSSRRLQAFGVVVVLYDDGNPVQRPQAMCSLEFAIESVGVREGIWIDDDDRVEVRRLVVSLYPPQIRFYKLPARHLARAYRFENFEDSRLRDLKSFGLRLHLRVARQCRSDTEHDPEHLERKSH